MKRSETLATVPSSRLSTNEQQWFAECEPAGEANPTTLSRLLAQGIDPNLDRGDGWTALMLCVSRGAVDAVEWLVANGADQSMRNNLGETPLHLVNVGASPQASVRVLQVLLKSGADVNARNRCLETPLIQKCKDPKTPTDVVRTLLNHGARWDVWDDSGTSSLLWAFLTNNLPVLDVMLNHGADPMWTVDGRRSVWNWALMINKDQCSDAMKRLIAWRINVEHRGLHHDNRLVANAPMVVRRL